MDNTFMMMQVGGALRDQYRGYRHPFLFGIHYLGGVGDLPRTVTELAMAQLSAEIRRLPLWHELYQEKDFRQRWLGDALKRTFRVRSPSSRSDVCLSEKQVTYVLDELSGYAALRDERAKCQVSCFERIWETDSVIDISETQVFQQELSYLHSEIRNGTRKDDGVTLVLIDPSLHCLVYERTLVSQGPGPSLPLHCPLFDVYTVSPRFAMLPSDVTVSTKGAVKFTSYINNLDPERSRLYESLESILGAFIPLFEHTLTDLHRNNPLHQRIPGHCRYTVWDEPEPPEFSDDEEGWTSYEMAMQHWNMNRPLTLPDVPVSGYPGKLELRKHRVSLRGKKLQVIVNVSETRLQPGGPSYSSSPWHVEGMRNERVVAAGMYFASMKNISSHSLQFRMAVTYPRGFSAGDSGATLRTWGLRDSDACHQYIGATKIRPGLGIVFPNIYQHRQTSFHLLDPTREGHQTVVSFLLVDPDILPIVSTSSVAPQQRSWVQKALLESLRHVLPVELIIKILDEVDGLMTPEEASNYRQEFLESRAAFGRANNEYHFCIPFDIWNGPEFAQ